MLESPGSMASKKRGRVLAVDHGTKRIGTALSDSSWTFAFPDRVFGSEKELIEYVKSLRQDLAVVVVGLPLNMDGTTGPRAREVLAFCERLAGEAQVEVVTWDERLTTVEAEELLREVHREKRRTVMDAVAAQRILSGYLAAERAKDGGGTRG